MRTFFLNFQLLGVFFSASHVLSGRIYLSRRIYYLPGRIRDPWVIQSPEELVTLKAELQATIKSLDALAKEGLPGAVGSKAEADALERGLTEALAQVRASKKNLK